MADTGMGVNDLRKLTVVKLRERLSELDLPTSGLKADLVERLHNHYKEQTEDDQAEENEEKDESMEDTRENLSPPSQQEQQQPPSLLSIQTKEPSRTPQQSSQITSPSGAPTTRTALQKRLQQLAGETEKNAGQQQQPSTTPVSQPPSLLSKQIPPPQMSQPSPGPQKGRPQMQQPVTPTSQPQTLLGSHQEQQPQQQLPSSPQQIGMQPTHPPRSQPPQPLMSLTGPSPQIGQPPNMGLPPSGQPPHMGPPPMGPLSQPGQSLLLGPPPQSGQLPHMGQPQLSQPPNMGPSQQSQPQHMVQPPQSMSMAPHMSQPPQMGQSQQMGPPPLMGQQQMGLPPQMGQQQMGPPPQISQQQMGLPPQMGQQQMGPPPQISQQQMGLPPQMGQQQMGPPPHMTQQQQMGHPSQYGQPTSQMPPPSTSQMMGMPMSMLKPPSFAQPPQHLQDPEFHEKVAMQTHMLEQERQQERLREQQQERLAIQQQAVLMQQQSAGEPDKNTDLMEKVRQQQIMLEVQKERMEQQQQALMEQQNQAMRKQEEERRRHEAELIRHQQIALMEAKREEQNRMSNERRGPPPPQQMDKGPHNFNPMPNMLQGPRPLLMNPMASGIPPLPRSLPSSTNNIPPLLPPLSSEQMRHPRPLLEEKVGPQEPKELKLPSALEKVLAFKDVRALEVGLTAAEIEELNMPEQKRVVEDDDEIEMVEMEDEDPDDNELVMDTQTSKDFKNKRRKKKKKKTKKMRFQVQPEKTQLEIDKSESDVHVEYVQEQLDLDPTNPNYYIFSKIFEAFKITDESIKDIPTVPDVQPQKAAVPAKAKPFGADSEDEENEDEKPEDDTPKMSKKKLKKLTRLSVAQLKQLVSRPDVVEMHDVTAQDPRLLVHLKATRNTVPVPRHWCFKRKYLQGKRGIEKPPFELPEYIQATGITEMRAALSEKEDQKNLKAKMREKVRPKMGKIDIDYQKLHDAFFRWQTKPKMTMHGDLYYEGKEFETKLREKKPGTVNMCDELKSSLGMPIGPQSEKVPPPWLIAMQRYGPPPAYPNLKIPGLNAGIPEGCSFGYHAGGWGKPPVDETGKPLYGDVFGTKSSDFEAQIKEDDIDKSKWGELESEEESEEESESESEEETTDVTGLVTPAEGLVTPSGITSVPMGMETPDMIELRKRRIEDSMDQGGETPALYQVIPEKKTTVGGAMMGSAHIYDMATIPGGPKKPGEKVSTEGIEVALNPEELDLDTAAMQAKYDQTLREQQSQLEKEEDLSDMVAEHAAKQKKRKKKQEESGKAGKKYKEFKF